MSSDDNDDNKEREKQAEEIVIEDDEEVEEIGESDFVVTGKTCKCLKNVNVQLHLHCKSFVRKQHHFMTKHYLAKTSVIQMYVNHLLNYMITSTHVWPRLFKEQITLSSG